MGYIECPGCASDPGYSVEKYRWFGAEHGALVGILFSGNLIAFFTQLYIWLFSQTLLLFEGEKPNCHFYYVEIA